jgi:hypothetical protein
MSQTWKLSRSPNNDGRAELRLVRGRWPSCVDDGYRRLVHEKTAAATSTALRLATSGGLVSATSLLAPLNSREGERQALRRT